MRGKLPVVSQPVSDRKSLVTGRSANLHHSATTSIRWWLRGNDTEDVLEAVQQRLDENPEAMRQRRETVEHPFGPAKIEYGKMRMGATRFLMKRLKNVRTEMAFSVLAYNLTRVINILGITPLIQAIRAQIASIKPRASPEQAQRKPWEPISSI